jgi:hypothetical protein
LLRQLNLPINKFRAAIGWLNLVTLNSLDAVQDSDVNSARWPKQQARPTQGF